MFFAGPSRHPGLPGRKLPWLSSLFASSFKGLLEIAVELLDQVRNLLGIAFFEEHIG